MSKPTIAMNVAARLPGRLTAATLFVCLWSWCGPANVSGETGRARLIVDKLTHITLVWSDAHGTAQSTYKATNDLFLSVDALIDCPCWYGNTFDPATGFSKENVSQEESVNNVEQIIIPAGRLTTGSPIRVSVVARNLMADGIVPDGGVLRQDFAVLVDNAHQ